MKQARVQTGKGIETITVSEVPIPEAGPGEALVRIKAATLNYRDLIIAKGLFPGLAKEPDVIPVSCSAGEVAAVGAGVTRVKPGDRVVPIFSPNWLSGPASDGAMLGGPIDGVATQYAVFKAESLCHLPDQLGDLEAATLPCAALTSWSALTAFRQTQPDEWILAHGTGGVSIAALQFAKAMGANVAITSSSDAKLARARSYGADVTVNYRTSANWVSEVRDAIGGNKIANVIDTVGGTQFDENVSLSIEGGQISAIGMLGSEFSWTKQASGVANQPIGVGNREQHEAMTDFIVKHDIKPPVDVVYDLDRIQDAYRHLESGKFFAKVALSLI
ncbi:MAG: NAD(P)-dependent alcohol dehydrogenase [Novosphingobium sp.]|nr:NAD(P)-dependent alcohol dehydrogenase [Novosphingobium sp.]MCP5402462.1 NAD(P)-dependent alcohol dehydrogenase [Novosphingobium sp.]